MERLRISLKAARVNADLSQQEAAIKLGISKATLQNYENGKTVPNWELVRRIESTYGISTENLFFPSVTLKADKTRKEATQ